MYTKALAYLCWTASVSGHMSLWYPGPPGGAKEANAMSTYVDPELNFPLGCCDKDGQATLPSPGICRGHLDLFNEQEPQVVWQAGQDAYFQLSDHAYTAGAPGSTHYGGSCQVGFSLDRGRTWKAAASFSGNCPRQAEDGSPGSQTFDFQVPRGMPSGNALFAWVWLNREHEFFINCAKVRIASNASRLPSADMLLSSNGVQNKDRPIVSRPYEWDTAPVMTTSYYTTDADCMPNAKLQNARSDDFELTWDVPCGAVEGDGAFPMQMIAC
ncbi:spore coat SP96 precursor [Pyrenophora seminiperda CCB06]|uniref:Spore coat SP96 n=1 Tax=Pyrenophora seminiperda CCB06 TaxID=1302712 RepID=A0A3M7LZV0_9PLEO|nr:spore coat SP96 precursor [Pyrenophora seminiperda CCB06]